MSRRQNYVLPLSLEKDCDTRTNWDKVKAFCPAGDVELIPPHILDAQGDEIQGITCRPVWAHSHSLLGTTLQALSFEWRVNKFANELLNRLPALDSVDAMRDTSTRQCTVNIPV